MVHYVQADDAVFQYTDFLDDLSGELSDTTRQTLKPANYFDACLQEPDLRLRTYCLLETTTGEITATCLEGHPYQAI